MNVVTPLSKETKPNLSSYGGARGIVANMLDKAINNWIKYELIMFYFLNLGKKFVEKQKLPSYFF